MGSGDGGGQAFLAHGFAFRAPVPGNATLHVHVVIGGPVQGRSPAVVSVNLTSAEKWGDRSCVLLPGEHAFLKKETVIRYEPLEIPLAVQAKIAQDRNLHVAKFSATILRRIQAGALVSEDAPGWLKAHLRGLGITVVRPG